MIWYNMLNYFNYRNFNTINSLIVKNLDKLPNDIDLIVGIPRSGLIVSTLIAEYRNLPHTDLYSFVNYINNFKLSKGSRAPNTDVKKTKHILLVDDAMGVGAAMKTALDLIKTKRKENFKITTYVVFVEPKSVQIPNLYCEVLQDQFLPWSILKRGIQDACCDIDGVLTEDVPNEVNDDGEKYINFLKNQKPKYRPDRKINTLVTERLEKYRAITEEWLRQHNVQYGQLIMCQCNNNIERNQQDMGKFKAEIFKKSGLQLFIESDFREATVIKSLNPDKCVYCMKIADYL